MRVTQGFVIAVFSSCLILAGCGHGAPKPQPTGFLGPQELMFQVSGSNPVSFQVTFIPPEPNPCPTVTSPLMSSGNKASCQVSLPTNGPLLFNAQITVLSGTLNGQAMHVRSCNAC